MNVRHKKSGQIAKVLSMVVGDENAAYSALPSEFEPVNYTATAQDLRISGDAARAIIVNVKNLVYRQYKNTPLWSLVSDITGHGSGYSRDVCKSANLDPNQTVTARPLRDNEAKDEQ